MDTKIKTWIRRAQEISRFLLNPEDKDKEQEIQKWRTEKSSRSDLIHELSQPDYYIRKNNHHKELKKKYTWEEFIENRKRKLIRRRMIGIGYAATILFVATISSVLLYEPQIKNPYTIVTSSISAIQPGGAKASLILDDGQEIALNNTQTITEKDGTVIHNGDKGELTYQSDSNTDTMLHHNTLRVPRGGEYRMILSDGTKVWINSESELIFPTQFTQGKREVYLKGEAYFEIAPDKNKPFYVHSNDYTIRATGTAFNVMAYTDENDIKVTLTEGGINIEKENKILSRLTPDQQFWINKQTGNFQVLTVDPRIATAWKNGLFFFERETLTSIARKLSRWYNIQIEINNPGISNYQFSGEIQKYEDAQKVLDMLKLTNEINYQITPQNTILIKIVE